MNNPDKTYLEQIDKFYNKKLRSYQIIEVGNTPEYLQRLGANILPIVIKQSTLSKCIREPHGSRSAHNLDRKMIESLPHQIRNPILAIEETKRNSFALISDCRDKDGNNMLIALKINATVQNMVVNEIVSFYGRTNLEIYLGKHNPSEIHVIDNNKAKQLASLHGLQLPTTFQALDYGYNLSRPLEKVNGQNEKKSVIESLHKYQKEIAENKLETNTLENQKSSHLER